MKPKFTLLASLTLLATACSAATPAVNSDQAKTILSNQSVLGTVWVRQSGEYAALTHQAFNSGKRYLKEFLANPANNAKKLAVTVDLDETMLDNSAYAAWQSATNHAYSSESWARWVHAKQATEVPGALDFANTVVNSGVTLFYVSNRDVKLNADTIKNMKALGFPSADEEHIMGKSTTSDKKARMDKIRAMGYTIVLSAGDNIDDFDSIAHNKLNSERRAHVEATKADFGTKRIMLPNPSYGGFEPGVKAGYFGLTTEGKLQARKEATTPWNGQ